ncbi:CACNA2D2 [Mytilus coruscus]|uniref:CACNA2D2 n=1 Tax=Mytilus coruscus TaxID=42192 RepID=A0A6J7ZYW8_MYTCO|nr:CACNA2D2 [Mytilus coruscus]
MYQCLFSLFCRQYVKNGSVASNLSDIYSAYKKWEKSGKDDGFWDNERLLTLHLDLEKTEHMHEFFNQFMLNRTEAIFVSTYGGLTRICPTGSKYKEKIERDRDTWKASYFKRALDYDGLVFSAPYTLKERTENDTEPIPDIMITKSVTVTAYNYKPAVIGSFVKHEKIVEILGTETDQNCGVDSSIDCYLLDDGAFLIASNREDHFDEVLLFLFETPYKFLQLLRALTEAIFVATYGGLTRICPTGSKYKEKIERDRDTWKASYFKRALDYDGLVFSAPYTLKERTENDTEPIPDIMITKSVTVTAYNYKPAVIGSFVKHEKIVEILGTETDQNCGVDSSIDCYLLDDGAFLIASNREDHFDEVGRFFGKIDPLLMHELYNISAYQRLEDFDYQATCSLNDSTTSSAIRLRVPSINILFELLTVNWWSSIWTWWVSNLSFYSWLNAPVVETATAPEVNKNYFSEIEGVIECINVNCTRNYKAIKLNNSKLKSNLMFVMADAKCDGCLEEKSSEMDLLQEPQVYEKESEHFCNKQARYRRVTEPCYDYHEKEESDCSGPLSTPVSVAVIVIATIVTVLCTWIR